MNFEHHLCAIKGDKKIAYQVPLIFLELMHNHIYEVQKTCTRSIMVIRFIWCDAEVNISHKPENLKKKFPPSGIPLHFSWFSTALWDAPGSQIVGGGGGFLEQVETKPYVG